jgi:hypothetical protein
VLVTAHTKPVVIPRVITTPYKNTATQLTCKAVIQEPAQAGAKLLKHLVTLRLQMVELQTVTLGTALLDRLVILHLSMEPTVTVIRSAKRVISLGATRSILGLIAQLNLLNPLSVYLVKNVE